MIQFIKKIPLLLPTVLFLAAGVGLFTINLVSTATKWPGRCGVTIVILFAIYTAVRETIQNRSKKAAAVLVGGFLLTLFGFIHASERPRNHIGASTERIVELRDILAERNIELIIATYPGYKNHFAEGRGNRKNPAPFENELVPKALKKLNENEVPVVDLGAIFQEYAGNKSAWENDEFHITTGTTLSLSEPIAEALTKNGPPPPNVVFIGDCFAGGFGKTMRKNDDEWKGLRVATTQGDRGKAPDFLFLFPDRYLKETQQVVWFLPYRMLSFPVYPPLNSNPDLGDVAATSVSVSLIRGPGWATKMKDVLRDLPYPDANIELTCEVIEDTETFKAGDKFVLVGSGVKERKALALAKVKDTSQFTANIVPYDNHAAKNPDIAKTYLATKDAPFELPRYWIHSWTYNR